MSTTTTLSPTSTHLVARKGGDSVDLNPWSNLGDEAPFVLPIDAEAVEQHNAKAKSEYRFNLSMAPEPWMGDPHAPVVVLTGNPRYRVDDLPTHARPDVRARLLAGARQEPQPYPLVWLDPALADTSGAAWYLSKLKALCDAVGIETVARNMVFFESLPYHSAALKQPKVPIPSQQHTNQRARDAVLQGKVVIWQRGPWPELLDLDLMSMRTVSRPNSLQSSYLSRKNLTPEVFDRVVEAMASGETAAAVSRINHGMGRRRQDEAKTLGADRTTTSVVDQLGQAAVGGVASGHHEGDRLQVEEVTSQTKDDDLSSPSSGVPKYGHVFVVQGDLTQIHADHVLVPCDGRLNVTQGWLSLLGPTEPGDGTWIRPAGVRAPLGFGTSERPPVEARHLPDGRAVWLVNSGGRSGDLGWLVAGVVEAIRQVSSATDRLPRHGRSRQLIAMPIFGVGDGGFGVQRGAVIKALLAALSTELSADGAPDVALVVNKRADYAAAQSLRRPSLEGGRVHSLADRIRVGELVLFIGSGASAGAGFPTWKKLLSDLAELAGLDATDSAAVLALPAPDAADVISTHLGPDRDLGGIISEKFRQEGFSLTHGLLASLRVNEAVTTNYDRLYENACTVPHNGQLIVLPHRRRKGGEPWLLKLHGDLEPSSSIVLTRDHYVRFDADSVPLASVVQSQMVIKHMLFIGYSLSDENFVRLARQVRQLFARTSPGAVEKVGTVLSLFTDPGRQCLWGDDLDFLPLTNHAYVEDLVPTAARELEIFLDDLAVVSSDEASYVLDPKYEDILTSADRELVPAVEQLVGLAGLQPTSAAWRKVARMLGELGGYVPGPASQPGPPGG